MGIEPVAAHPIGGMAGNIMDETPETLARPFAEIIS